MSAVGLPATPAPSQLWAPRSRILNPGVIKILILNVDCDGHQQRVVLGQIAGSTGKGEDLGELQPDASSYHQALAQRLTERDMNQSEFCFCLFIDTVQYILA
jgi:hypothetical protein